MYTLTLWMFKATIFQIHGWIRLAELFRLLNHFLSLDLRKELEFIHRSCDMVGYRPNVFSTTLSHLIATYCAYLVLPFISIRVCLKDKIEEFFGCEFELFIEFTGFISWCKGACIGWHSDDNRHYLKQRDFAVVCYLNSHGTDFKGGEFCFKDGEPSTIVPIAGDVLIYTADDRNIHSVEEVLDGERLTLTLWFTRNKAHDEDSKLISLISEMLSNHEEANDPKSYLPLPASDSMYWFSRDQLGFDVRCARAHILGYSFYTTTNDKYNIPDLSDDSTGVLSKPLRLGRDQIFEKEFINSLHALQVVQFYYWKSDELITSRTKAENCTGSTEPFLLAKKSGVELDLPCNHQLAKRVLGHISQGNLNLSFDWSEFAHAVAKWEEYSYSLQKDLLNILPFWLSHQIMFFIGHTESQKCNMLAE